MESLSRRAKDKGQSRERVVDSAKEKTVPGNGLALTKEIER
jgi:hypothetical protein